MKINQRAFSLIELSIVILIIGILVAGVTQSSRLVAQFRISTAKTLTQSSPVSAIKNLVVWYEAVGEKSFLEAEAADGTSITTWYDNNPQSSYKNNATQSTGSLKPEYKENCINSLPCVNFGTDANTALVSINNLNSTSTTFTIFIVSNITSAASLGSSNIVSSGNWVIATHFAIPFYTINSRAYDRWGGGSVNTASIHTLADDGTVTDVYTNGTLTGSANGAYVASKTFSTFTLGPNNFVYLGEIIIFDSKLKTEERKAVEQYLSKKWGIKVS